MNHELEAFITQATLEVDRDLSLPANSLVDATALPEMNEKVTLKTLRCTLIHILWQQYQRSTYNIRKSYVSTKKWLSKRRPSRY